jgi:hypothetical protein
MSGRTVVRVNDTRKKRVGTSCAQAEGEHEIDPGPDTGWFTKLLAADDASPGGRPAPHMISRALEQCTVGAFVLSLSISFHTSNPKWTTVSMVIMFVDCAESETAKMSTLVYIHAPIRPDANVARSMSALMHSRDVLEVFQPITLGTLHNELI